MTKTMEWLRARSPGFNRLSENELNAIADFTLLWSLFEARVLNTSGSATHIRNAVQRWHDAGTLDASIFDEELAYFRGRYHASGRFTHHFDQLHLRDNDEKSLVRGVINGSDSNLANCVTVILIVIFRYRNNLFHGLKWQYELEGQFDNFTVANSAIRKILERHVAF